MLSPVDYIQKEVALSDTKYEPVADRLAALFAVGYSRTQIAEELGLSEQEIARHLVKVSHRWEKVVSDTLEAQIGREVAAQDLVSRMAYKACKDSTTPHPEYLKLMVKTSENRAKFLSVSQRLVDASTNKGRQGAMSDLLDAINESPTSSVISVVTRQEAVPGEG